jgi:hypothetical protein
MHAASDCAETVFSLLMPQATGISSARREISWMSQSLENRIDYLGLYGSAISGAEIDDPSGLRSDPARRLQPASPQLQPARPQQLQQQLPQRLHLSASERERY